MTVLGWSVSIVKRLKKFESEIKKIVGNRKRFRWKLGTFISFTRLLPLAMS